jgi:hypothetical protein
MRFLFLTIIISLLVYSLWPIKNTTKKKVTNDSFSIGEKITCLYDGIYSNIDNQEYVKYEFLSCTVIDVSKPIEMFPANNYQHIRVDCSEGIAKEYYKRLVKNHPLNYKIRWFGSDRCYHYYQKV